MTAPKVEPNALAQAITGGWDKFKQGQLISYPLMALMLLLVTGIGVTWWVLHERTKTRSAMWVELDEANRICPEPLVTNQLEFHAYLPQQKLYDACRRYGMVLTAYSPTARTHLLTDPIVNDIARDKGKTAAQIALRYVIQHPGIAAVPRAHESAHAAENLPDPGDGNARRHAGCA